MTNAEAESLQRDACRLIRNHVIFTWSAILILFHGCRSRSHSSVHSQAGISNCVVILSVTQISRSIRQDAYGLFDLYNSAQ